MTSIQSGKASSEKARELQLKSRSRKTTTSSRHSSKNLTACWMASRRLYDKPHLDCFYDRNPTVVSNEHRPV